MKTILIIDDERIITRALTRAFEREGFGVEVAQDGEEGLNKINESKASLILLDILMPKLTGLQVLEKMRKSNIQTPVILMTAYGDSQTEKTAKLYGISAYLKKPFNNIDDVVSLVKTTLKSI